MIVYPELIEGKGGEKNGIREGSIGGGIKLSSLKDRVQIDQAERPTIESIWSGAIEKSDEFEYHTTYNCLVNVEGLGEMGAELAVDRTIRWVTLAIKIEDPKDFLPDATFAERNDLEPGMRWGWASDSRIRDEKGLQHVYISRHPESTREVGSPEWWKTSTSLLAAEFSRALESLTGGRVKVTPSPNIVQEGK